MLNSPVCVDANIVVSLVTPETQSEKSLNLWTRWMQEDVRVIAPFLLRYEVTSALRRKMVRGVMSYEDARRSLEEVLSLDIEFLDQPELSLRAFDIASRFNRPTAYDAYYLALELLFLKVWGTLRAQRLLLHLFSKTTLTCRIGFDIIIV